MEGGGASFLAIGSEGKREVADMREQIGEGRRAVRVEHGRELVGALFQRALELLTATSRPVRLAADLRFGGALTHQAQCFVLLVDGRHALGDAAHAA